MTPRLCPVEVPRGDCSVFARSLRSFKLGVCSFLLPSTTLVLATSSHTQICRASCRSQRRAALEKICSTDEFLDTTCAATIAELVSFSNFRSAVTCLQDTLPVTQRAEHRVLEQAHKIVRAEMQREVAGIEKGDTEIGSHSC